MKLFVLVLSASILLTIISLPVMWSVARKWKLERRNFRGDTIPAGFGFLLTISSVPVYALIVALQRSFATIWLFLCTVLGFGILGLIDDLYGNRSVGGFGGHFGMLRHGKVSTGLMKAVVGGLLSMAVGIAVSRWSLVPGNSEWFCHRTIRESVEFTGLEAGACSILFLGWSSSAGSPRNANAG